MPSSGAPASALAASAAASMFSTLCRPRMGISPASMQRLCRRRSSRPSQPGRPGFTSRRLLNQSMAAGVLRRIRDADRIVGVQDRAVAGLLGLEQARLGRRVALEGVVPVQMILA